MIKVNNYNEKYLERYNFHKILPSFLYKFVLQQEYKRFYKYIGKTLNLKNPQCLSEKIQWLKLNDNFALKTQLTDKLLAKEYIKLNCANLKTAKVFQVGKSFKDIDWETLPEKFVLKTNHAWKTNFFIENKSILIQEEIKSIEEYYEKVLKINYAFWSFYELQYKKIIPQIYAEEIIGSLNNQIEYEVYCFNGKPCFLNYRTFSKNRKENGGFKQHFYDINWNKLNFFIGYGSKDDVKCPNNFSQVVSYSSSLCKKFKFVRLDFIEVDNILYFGEFTFTPSSGLLRIFPYEYDRILGEKLYID